MTGVRAWSARVDLDGYKGLMWHGKGLGIVKIGPGRSLEISCDTDSRGQTEPEHWMWSLGYIELLGRRYG